jgi:glucose/arabinose dehydrogenase
LLGLAFHPNFPADGRLFVYYTNKDDDTVLASYQVDPETGQAEVDSAWIMLTIGQAFTNHNGGQLAFGPDGYLYVAVGEGGLSRDPGPDSLLGKILRLDVDADEPYAVPEDNPFVDDPDYRPEIWALGMRNPWRFLRMSGKISMKRSILSRPQVGADGTTAGP